MVCEAPSDVEMITAWHMPTCSPGPVSPAHGLQRRLRSAGGRRPGRRGRGQRCCWRRGRRGGSSGRRRGGSGNWRRRDGLQGEQCVVPVQRRSPAQSQLPQQHAVLVRGAGAGQHGHLHRSHDPGQNLLLESQTFSSSPCF